MIKYMLLSRIQIALFNWPKKSSYCLKLVLSGIGKGTDHSIIQYVAHLNNGQAHNTTTNFFCFYLKSHLLVHINNNTRGVKSSHDMDHRFKLTIENSTQSCTCFDNGVMKQWILQKIWNIIMILFLGKQKLIKQEKSNKPTLRKHILLQAHYCNNLQNSFQSCSNFRFHTKTLS